MPPVTLEGHTVIVTVTLPGTLFCCIVYGIYVVAIELLILFLFIFRDIAYWRRLREAVL